MDMKKTLRIAFLVVAALVLVGTGGYLTLSAVKETNFATFGACLLFLAAGAIGRDRFFFRIVCGLLAAYILSTFVLNWRAFFAPLTCLLFFTAGNLLQWRAMLKFPLMLALAALVSFVLVPMYFLIWSIRPLPKSSPDLKNLRFLNPQGDTLSIRDFSSKYLLIETWHEYCGLCFKAMRDLHPQLEKWEQAYDFEHIYLYSRAKGLSHDRISTVKYLPYPDLPLYYDLDQNLCKKMDYVGAPYFLLLNPEGKIVREYEGYGRSGRHVLLYDMERHLSEK